jgi:hypothetical protein
MCDADDVICFVFRSYERNSEAQFFWHANGYWSITHVRDLVGSVAFLTCLNCE